MSLRIGVVGAGAIGGFLTAHLCEAGYSVSVLAREQTRDALRKNGLRLSSGGRDIIVRPEQVSEDAAQIGNVDLILFTVKGQDTAAAAAAMRAMIGPQTKILSFQNGIFGVETLAEMFGRDAILAGVTYVPAVVQSLGVVHHTGAVKRFVFGPYAPDAPPCPIAQAFAEAGRAAGLEMVLLDAPMPEIWAKFVMLTPFHLVSCMTRLPLGGWIDTDATRAVYRSAMEEVVHVAKACGVAVADTLVARNIAFSVETADRGTRASMLEDLERGRPLELEATVGWLVRTARRHGIKTPVHDIGYAMLKPSAEGAPV
jgi:2-dehydropantoate 2-reductase